jgi:hypothetical protein
MSRRYQRSHPISPTLMHNGRPTMTSPALVQLPPPPPATRTEIVKLTPALAQQLLDANPRNRTLNERAVTTYARDMIAGNWTLNGESVKVSMSGLLVDGQHRCLGVVQSGVTIETVIVWDLPDADEVRASVDIGRGRTPGDELTLRGVSNGRNVASVARLLMAWEYGSTLSGNNFAPTRQELLDYVFGNPDISEGVSAVYRRALDHTDCNPSVLTVAYIICRRLAGPDANTFFGQVLSGADLGVDAPALALRNLATRIRKSGVPQSKDEALGQVFSAWNAYRRNRPLRALRAPASGWADAPLPL